MLFHWLFCLFFKITEPGFITSDDPWQKVSISPTRGKEIWTHLLLQLGTGQLCCMEHNAHNFETSQDINTVLPNPLNCKLSVYNPLNILN
jgi:hypothetical protein